MAASGKRSVVYVDGFNLYYGAIRGTPYKWLDIERYFKRLRQDDSIQRIDYFTALVDGPARPRQEVYLRALSTLPLVRIIYGRYKHKRVRCSVSGCTFSGDRWFQVPEEKRTDVNIATQMMRDAHLDVCDRFIIVSGDSDLVPPVEQIKLDFPRKRFVVYVPARSQVRGAAVELRSAADRDATLPLALLRVSQLPELIPDGPGGVIAKPASW